LRELNEDGMNEGEKEEAMEVKNASLFKLQRKIK